MKNKSDNEWATQLKQPENKFSGKNYRSLFDKKSNFTFFQITKSEKKLVMTHY